MAITELQLRKGVDLESAWEHATNVGLDAHGLEEIRDCWDCALIWEDWLEQHFGIISAVRHRSPPDDPPDIELIFGETVVGVEHTRLQPPPLGWSNGLRTVIDPRATTVVPSLSNPPIGQRR